MPSEFILTREIPPLPARPDDGHKGDFGRIVVIGGCSGAVTMAGAPALTANAALRSGAGLVQILVPPELLAPVSVLSPCSTLRALPGQSARLLEAVDVFQPDVVALGPGLGDSLAGPTIAEFLSAYQGLVVLDADGLNQLASSEVSPWPNPSMTVFTPHPGEANRLFAAARKGEAAGPGVDRRSMARSLVQFYGGVVVLKGAATIVTDGRRLYRNETGNAGMATAGSGDVLTGVIAGLLGQKMEPLEAAILGVNLHGLAGDFAAEELGRRSVTALDILDFLPEAFTEHALAENA